MEAIVAILVLLVLVILLIVANIKIVPQSKAYVIERLGTYHATWDTGLHVKIPFIEKVAKIAGVHWNTGNLFYHRFIFFSNFWV